MHLLADGIVFLAELEELGEFSLKDLRLLAQRQRLALGERDGAAAVGVRHLDVLQELGVLLEKLRVGAEELSDVVVVHLFFTVRCLRRKPPAPGPSSTPHCRRRTKRWSTLRRACARARANRAARARSRSPQRHRR